MANRCTGRQDTMRKRLLRRCGHQCQQCGFIGYVELHHRISVRDGGTFAEDNLILLCERCHKTAHFGTGKVYKRIFAELQDGTR